MGTVLVVLSDWGFTTPWILVGLGGFATTFVTGIAFLKPVGERIADALGRDAAMDPAIISRLKKRLLVERIDMAVLITVVFDMAVKPSGAELGAAVGCCRPSDCHSGCDREAQWLRRSAWDRLIAPRTR